MTGSLEFKLEACDVEEIRRLLLEWFSINGRHHLPWKLNQKGQEPKLTEFLDPYKIWIAEIMLQQTQLKVVLPFWQRWVEIFPDLKVLAISDEQKVLLCWQGLGYYNRAKRLYKSAQALYELIGPDDFDKAMRWPQSIEVWMALPGIGRSTAGSILSSCFNLPFPILDGNVKRVLSRLIASNVPLKKDEKRLWSLSLSLLSKDFPRNFNQALMDLGANICTPKKPRCTICPLKSKCIAFSQSKPVFFPVQMMNKKIPNEIIGVGIIINRKGQILIAQRLEKASMGGMWEFPGGKKNNNESIDITIARELREEIGVEVEVGVNLISFEHKYTHKTLHFIVHICKWLSGIPQPLESQKILWVYPKELVNFPFPNANIKIISSLKKYLNLDSNSHAENISLD